MATGDLVKLGTLYMGSTKIPRPTKPWRNSSEPYSGAGVGNIQSYSVGSTLEIRDTEANDADKMQWIEVNDGGKKYLICDRVMLVNISWDDLNAQNLIFGKNITIDGQQYKLRVLTGGAERREGGSGTSYGGGKLPNEWDNWIVNEANLSGLPKPSSTDLDSGPNYSQHHGSHNQLWNWMGVYSWCQETYLHNTALRAFRGSNSARHWSHNSASSRYNIVGWRPVLEVLNSAPVISGDQQNLGNKTAPFTVNYQVSDPEGDKVDVVVKLNGTVVDTKTNITQNVNHTFTITPEQWASLPLNQESTITIEATDSKNAKSTRVHTFVKANSEPTAVVVEPKGDLANIAIVDTLTPVLVHQFQDPDSGDVQTAYQYIIEDLQENIVHDTGKKLSTQSFFQVPQGVLNWGVRYKFKVRVWDKFDVPSEYTAYEFFLPNRAPNITDLQPGTNDPNNPIGTGTSPEFTWTFEDLDLEAQQSYQLKIYNLSDTLIYDSSRIYKNVNKHQIPDGVLTDGTVYYAVLTVWDPNNLSKTSEKAYFRTNATPQAPILTSPIDNYRTSLKPTFVGIVGTDQENDGMHFAVQISKNSDFEGNEVLTFRSDQDRTGWQVGGYDIPQEGVFNDKQGQQVSYTMQFDLDRNQTYYWRMAAIDAQTRALGKWSPTRKIRVGNVLQFTLSNPISTGGTAARRILFAMDYFLPTDGSNKATIKVEFANNGLDVNPTWEDGTEEFLNMDYYNFVNQDKTATEYAINVRVTINANDSLQPIYIDAMGLTFD